MIKTCKLIDNNDACKTQKGCIWKNNQCGMTFLNKKDKKKKEMDEKKRIKTITNTCKDIYLDFNKKKTCKNYNVKGFIKYIKSIDRFKICDDENIEKQYNILCNKKYKKHIFKCTDDEDCLNTCEKDQKCSQIEISKIQNLSRNEIKKILMLTFGLKELIFIHYLIFIDRKRGQLLSYNKLLETLSMNDDIYGWLVKFLNASKSKLKLDTISRFNKNNTVKFQGKTTFAYFREGRYLYDEIKIKMRDFFSKDENIRSLSIPNNFVVIGFSDDKYKGDGCFYRTGEYTLDRKQENIILKPKSLIIRKNATENYKTEKKKAIEIETTVTQNIGKGRRFAQIKVPQKRQLPLGQYTRSELNSHLIPRTVISLTLYPNFEAIIFGDDNFKGDTKFIKQGEYQYKNIKIPIGSMIIKTPKKYSSNRKNKSNVKFYSGKKFNKNMFECGVGEFNTNDIINLNGKPDTISSIEIPIGYMVVIFKDDNFEGESRYLKTGQYNAKDLGGWNWGTFNNKISSFIVFTDDNINMNFEIKNKLDKAGATVYTEKNFEGISRP